MRQQSISVTEAARHFADCINLAHYQNMTFVLLTHGSPVARLVPDKEKICTGRDLARLLASAELPEAEAAAWHRERQSTRETVKAPTDKWP